MDYKKKRSITLRIDNDGYITIDEAVKQTDQAFLDLIRKKRRK